MLPDTSFLFIKIGGRKDHDGMTTPRTLRHLQFKDEDGNLDAELIEDAIDQIENDKVAKLSEESKADLLSHAKQLLKQAEGKLSTAFTEDTMDKELLAILGLTEAATPEEIKAAILKMKDGPAVELVEVKKELETASEKLESTKVELLNARDANPSLDKFVPRSEYDVAICRANDAEKLIEDSEKKAHADLVTAEVDAACVAGKVTPVNKDFYIDTCSTKEGLEKFRAFVATAPVVGDKTDLDHKDPPSKDTLSDKLTADERVIARNCGQTDEQFLAGRA